MKSLNCANCGSNLKYSPGAPVTICEFCDSVNILENIKLKIEQPLSSSNDGPPNFIEDLKPRILLPQLSYRAKFRQGEYIGILGKFLISNTEIFFLKSCKITTFCVKIHSIFRYCQNYYANHCRTIL